MNTDKARLGAPTASNFHYIITPEGKPSRSQERRSYLHKLAYERLTGEKVPEKFAGNEFTEHGLNSEMDAAAAFSKQFGVKLNMGRFILHPRKHCGCTPDRLIAGKHEAVEIKSPAGWTHIGYMVEGPGSKYYPQAQGQLLVGGFDCVHFWSWHPRFASVHDPIKPDDAYQRTLSELLDRFAEELDATVDYVRRHGNIEQLTWPEGGEAA